ncbi:MAG: SDR family NAD(P)-dependent oxidoreductase [Acidimicrobiales bacterium]
MAAFDGLSAFVTGGGTGIGLACAKRIVAEGGRVAIAGRRVDVLEAAAKEIGDGAFPVQCDITNNDSVLSAVQSAVKENGPLRLAVNSAYQAMVGSALATPPDLFSMTVDSTLTGTYRCMQAQAKAMREAGGGSIVNISSVAAGRSGRWESAYSASKAGVDMLTRVAADEWGQYDIRVNSVLPGLTKTDTAAPLTEDPTTRQAFIRHTPLARLGETDDIANGVAFLLSDGAAFITGQCLCIDGGLSLRGLPEPEHGRLLRSLIPDFFADGEP